MSEIELVFRRAEFLCSGSLYSMFFLEKTLYLIQVLNQYLLNEKDDTCPFEETNLSAWLNYHFEGVKDVMNTRW